MDKADLDLSEFEPADSPCKLICSVDRESERCFGCGRSTVEIAQWTLLSQDKRNKILAELPARMPALTTKLEERRKKRRVNKRRRNTATEK